MNLIDQLERDEGFRSKPYQDTEGIWTIGHGFTSLSLDESRKVLKMKVRKIQKQLSPLIRNLTPARQDVLVNMAYNLGLDGLYRFKRMWAAIYSNDYDKAAEEMLNSKWAIQVKGRAIRLAEIMRKG